MKHVSIYILIKYCMDRLNAVTVCVFTHMCIYMYEILHGHIYIYIHMKYGSIYTYMKYCMDRLSALMVCVFTHMCIHMYEILHMYI